MTTLTLRPYQQIAADAGIAFLTAHHPPSRPHQPGIIVMPTGAGKSPVIAHIVSRLDRPCLVLQPTKEILEQNRDKLLAYGFFPAIYSASFRARQIGQITLATIGSVVRRPERFEPFGYILIDECHLARAKDGMYQRFLEALSHLRVLGLTATPYRLAPATTGAAQVKMLTRTRPRIFKTIIHCDQIAPLMRDGYLATLTYHRVHGFSRAALTTNASRSDYDDGSIRRHFNQIGFADRLRRVVLRLRAVGRRSVVVFTRFVEDAEQLVAAVGGVVVSADTPKEERAAIIRGLRAGTITTVANVSVLAVGFDYPELDTVVLARPTLSLALFYQQVGRVMRPHPSKTSAWVVDLVDNLGTFGPIEEITLQGRADQWDVYAGRRRMTPYARPEIFMRPGIVDGSRSTAAR